MIHNRFIAALFFIGVLGAGHLDAAAAPRDFSLGIQLKVKWLVFNTGSVIRTVLLNPVALVALEKENTADMIAYLAHKGALLSTMSLCDPDPLCLAIRFGHPKVVAALLAYPAVKVEGRGNNERQNPLRIALLMVMSCCEPHGSARLKNAFDCLRSVVTALRERELLFAVIHKHPSVLDLLSKCVENLSFMRDTGQFADIDLTAYIGFLVAFESSIKKRCTKKSKLNNMN